MNSLEGIPGQLRILLLEDDPSDAELILHAVGNGGITHVSKSVSARDEFRAALTEFGPDLVLSDYQLPGFNGIDALTIVRERNPDLPFILVTGALGEEFAVETIKRGATDYILKDRLSHLVPAILRAMRETEQRSRRRQAEELVRHQQEKALRESEARMNSILQSAQDAIITIDHQGMIVEFNAAAEKTFGCHRAVVIGREMALVIIPPSFRRWFQSGLPRSFAGDEGPVRGSRIEMVALRADGTEFPVECTITQIEREGPPMFTVFISDITRRNRAEEQIRRLADAVQSTQELISIADHENRFTFVNQAFLDAYGYSESEVLGRTPDFLYSPNNPPGLCKEVFQQTVRAGWRGEILNRRKDGTEFTISISTSTIKTSAGETIGLMGVARDISERKRAEKQSAAFALLGRHLSRATAPGQAAYLILDIASELFGWDAAYVHLYSQAEDKIIPVLTVDIVEGHRTPISPDTLTLEPSPLMRAILKEGSQLINREKNSPASVEFVPFGDSHRRSASMMYAPIHASGTVLGILSIQSYTPHAYSERDLHLLQILADHCGDALLRIEVTEAMLAAEARYRSIFENATEGVFQTTPEGRYRDANPALARMLGYQTPQELRSSVSDLERQTYVLPEKREELQRLLETQGSVQGFEVERYRKDGSKVWMSINAHVVRDASGAILYYEGTNQDITGRKLAEEELRRLPQRIIEAQEAERLRVARELHDGVNQLLASAKLRLRKVEETVTALSPAAGEILGRCNQLLVRALEENRRIAHGLRPSDLDELGLAAACKNLCKEFQSRTTLAVESRVPRNWSRLPPAVELNLFRIVQEAFTNVEKHAHAKTVRLRLALEGDIVLLRIRDDGDGFDPNASPTAKKQRRGIGLTNMCERAAAIGGTCEVASGPKQGTTIAVRVPRGDAK